MSSHYGKEYKTLNPKTDAHLDTTLEKRNTRCRLRGSTREFTHSHRQLEQERRELRKKFDETIGETMCLHSHLIENVYSSLCSKYPRGGVEEWRDKFFGAQTDHYVPGKMVTKKWVERFLAPHLGVSPKAHPYEEFVRVLAKPHEPAANKESLLKQRDMVSRLVEKLEEWPIIAAECSYFRREIHGIVNHAHRSIELSQRALAAKIEQRYYEDEYEETMNVKHTAMSIPEEKILDSIMGKKKTPAHHHYLPKQKGKLSKSEPAQRVFAREKMFQWEMEKRYNTNEFRRLEKKFNTIANLLEHTFEEKAGTLPADAGTKETPKTPIVPHPPVATAKPKEESMSVRQRRNAPRQETADVSLADYEFGATVYGLGRDSESRTSRESSRSSTDSHHRHRHLFTPDSPPPTPFRVLDHDDEDRQGREAHVAVQMASEIYQWHKMGTKVRNRYRKRSNELPQDAKQTLSDLKEQKYLGNKLIVNKLVSLKTQNHSQRPMSVRHRLLEASAQLNALPFHFGIKSSDVHHQIERCTDHKNCGLNDQNLAVILHGLKNINGITALNFQGNRFTPSACKSIASFLRTNASVEHLNLAGNERIGAKGVSFLIPSFGHLVELNLSKCRIDNVAVDNLCIGLHNNSSVASLLLSHNQISDRGAVEIAAMIPRHRNLRDLVLSWNAIRNPGGSAIGRALRDNSSMVECLDLSYNAFGGGSGEANVALEFSQAFFSNRRLHHVSLAHNRLTKQDLFVILSRIEDANNTALALHLEGNWSNHTSKTHEGHAKNAMYVFNENNKEARMLGYTGCEVFDNALHPSQPSFGEQTARETGEEDEDEGKNDSPEAAEDDDGESQGPTKTERGGAILEESNSGVVFDPVNLRIHATAHLEANEALHHHDFVDANHHGFDSVVKPGSSMLFTRVLGRPHMKQKMEWKECDMCWVCCEASEYCFELDSIGEIGTKRIANGGTEEWWKHVEVWYVDATGRRRKGKAGPSSDGNKVFRHYAMLVPGKVHYFFRDSSVPLDLTASKARAERSIYTHTQAVQRKEAAVAIQRKYRRLKGLQPFKATFEAGSFHISTHQATESSTKEELLFFGLSFANYAYIKPRSEALVPDSNFIRKRPQKKEKGWTKAASAFKKLQLDTDPLLQKALKVDWTAVEFIKLLRTKAEEKCAYKVLLHHYKLLLDIFKFYCTDRYDIAAVEDLYSLSKLLFLQILEDAGVLHNKLSNKERGAFERVYIGSLLSKSHEKLSGLFRPQFLVALCRVAQIMNPHAPTKAEAFEMFLENRIKPLAPFDYDAFRKKFLLNKETDLEISFYIPMLRKLFKQHSDMNIETNETNVMYLDNFLESLKKVHLDDDVVDKREKYRMFLRSQNSSTQPFGQPAKRYLRFYEWIDALCWGAFLLTVPEENAELIDDYRYLKTHMKVLPLRWFIDKLHMLLKDAEVSHKRGLLHFTMLSKVKAMVHRVRRRAISSVHHHREEALMAAHKFEEEKLKQELNSEIGIQL